MLTAFFFAHRKHQTQDRKWTGKINKLQTIRRKLYDENKTKNKIRTPKRKLFISPSIMISAGLTGCRFFHGKARRLVSWLRFPVDQRSHRRTHFVVSPDEILINCASNDQHRCGSLCSTTPRERRYACVTVRGGCLRGTYCLLVA